MYAEDIQKVVYKELKSISFSRLTAIEGLCHLFYSFQHP